MINTDKIEAGDKVHLRDGSVIVARRSAGDGDNEVRLLGAKLASWFRDGRWLSIEAEHPLDIIRIEKKPKPVVETYWFGKDGKFCSFLPPDHLDCWPLAYKITITDGEATIERAK